MLPGESTAFLDALAQPANTSVRLHPVKGAGLFSEAISIAWCNEGKVLNERPSFIADPNFHAGAYYVQESSSMFLSQVFQSIRSYLPDHPKVLDMCAAPGGKSTLLLSELNHQGVLVSNEVIRSRTGILKENLDRWGYANCIVTSLDPQDLAKAGSVFDVVVIDAPCSGEGMFRKDEQAADEWSETHVQLCAARQQRIMDEADRKSVV